MTNASERFAAYIGLDWADTKHDICLATDGSSTFEYDLFPHSPESIENWALGLQRRFKGQPIAICLELKAGPLVYALLKYDFFVLFPIAPKALAKYREAFCQSGAKDDPTDAFLQLDYLLKHPEALTALRPDNQETRILQRLTEDRRDLVEDKVRLTNRIGAALKSYYPQALEWFESTDTLLFCDFIQQWPTLKQAQRARKATLERFFKSHNCARPTIVERRLSAIKTALPLTEDDAVILPLARLVTALVEQLKTILHALRDYDLEIAKRFRMHDDHHLFESLPGAGPVFGPRLLAGFGSDRTRFKSADELTRLSGIAPVVEKSGKRSWTHWRYACPKFLRQTFVEWAYQSTRYSFWAKQFYDKKREQGKSHQAALRALAFKWIRVVFRCWQNRTPYDESKYLFALQRRSDLSS